MNWIKLEIETTHERVDLVASILYDAGVNGVVIEDPADIIQLMEKYNNDEMIDPDLLNNCPEKVTVKGYLPADEGLHDRVEMVKDRLKELASVCECCGSLELAVDEVREEDWAESWKKYYKPIRIGNNIVIKPSWESYRTGERDVVVEIDPGMAFGTGTHETTALCIQLLEQYITSGARVLDIGCGSGILAIVAARLGAARVEAYDIQKVAVKVARENVKLNGLEQIVSVQQGDLLSRVEGRADLICANIIADVIIRMAPEVSRHLKPEGIFIASGIIRDRKQEVMDALDKEGLDIIQEFVKNEWVALVAKAEGK